MKILLLVAMLASLHAHCMGMFVAKKLRHVKMAQHYSRYTNTDSTYTAQWLVENGFDNAHDARMDKVKRYSGFGQDFETWDEIIHIRPIDIALKQKNIPILRSIILEHNNYNLDEWLKNNGFNNPHDEREVVVKMYSGFGEDAEVHEEKIRINPIHLAIEQKNVSIILSLLIGVGVDIETRNNNGQTMLMAILEACNYQDISWSYTDPITQKVIDVLMTLGADVNAQNTWTKKMALHVAAAGGPHAEKFVRMLLEKNAAVNAQDIDGRTPLHDAAQSFDSVEIIEALITWGAKPEIRCKESFYGGKMRPYDVAVRALWKHSSKQYQKAPQILDLLQSKNPGQGAGNE